MEEDVMYGESMILRKCTDNDISTIETWLNKEYIKKWYGDPNEWLDEIRNLSGAFDWLNHFIAEHEGTPIGFCQYYDCSKTPKGYEWDNEPPGTFGIDYMIGEEQFLKKGLGSAMIQLLIDLIKSNENVKQIFADPVKENKASIKLLEKNGFALDEPTGLYKISI